MRIIIFLCLLCIIFFACVCISFGYRLLSKLQDIQDDLAALEDLNNEQHSIPVSYTHLTLPTIA